MSDLKKKIEERRQEAVRKCIREKAEVVAKEFGESPPVGVGIKLDYGSGPFRIHMEKDYLLNEDNSVIDESANGLWIESCGTRVFHCDGSGVITSYIPVGDWEKTLDDDHASAIQVINNREREAKRKARPVRTESEEEAAERARWGL